MEPALVRTPRRSLTFELLVVVSLALFAAVCTSGHVLHDRVLFLDNRDHYSFYFDNFHSLNRFGEPAYWAPHIQQGYPLFYLSVLGQTNVSSPTFVLTAAVLWVAGRLGFWVEDFHALFALYTGFLFPILFCLGVYALGRQVFRSRVVLLYLLIVAAFSPAVVLNTSDPGILDLAAYWLFMMAACLAHLRRPSRRSYLVLSLAAFVLCVSMSVCWPNLLPVFVAFLLVALMPPGWKRARRSLAAVSAWHWFGTIALAALCALPNVLALRSSGLLARARLESVRYEFAQLKPGNPLEPLAASVPGIGFHWDHYWPAHGAPPRQYLPRPVERHRSAGYVYLGILALPLAVFGLFHGKAWLRLRLLVLLLLSSLVATLSGYSPLFGAALLLPTPLRSYNHFGDQLFSGGGFLVLLFAAGMGLDAYLHRSERTRRRLLWIWFPSGALSVGAYLLLHWSRPDRFGTLFGFLALLMLVVSVLLSWLARAQGRALRRRLTAVLLLVALVDVATVAFWHVRLLAGSFPSLPLDRTGPDSVGLDNEKETGEARSALTLTSLRALKRAGVPIDRLPPLALYHRAHLSSDVERDDVLAAAGDAGARSLALGPEAAVDSELEPMLAGRPSKDAAGRIEVVKRTYNELTLRVQTEEPAFVFVRDAHFPPYWRAWVNDEEAPVRLALGAFKAVRVAAGESVVRLRFRPGDVIAASWVAYAIILAWASVTIRAL